jgi:HAD superfamily hydrolase (TIGR01549 family)
MSSVDLTQVRGLLFDLGGTLDGDGEHWLNRFYLLYQKHLPHADFSTLKAAFYEAEAACVEEPMVASLYLAGLIAFHVNRQLQALGLNSPDAADTLAAAFLASCRRSLKRNVEILSRLAPRFRLGVITNFYGNAARLLAEEGLAPLLTTIVDSAIAGVRKPDPAIFHLALRELGLTAAQVVYVGDSYGQDVRPAKAVGLITVWLRNDAMSAPLPPDFDPHLADFQIHSLTELEALLS